MAQQEALPDGVVVIQGRPYPTLAYALGKAHEAGLMGMESELIQIPDASNQNIAIVKVTIILPPAATGEPERRFEALGDASPANVKSHLVPAIIRYAECVPLRAEMLTRDGWVGPWDLRPGEPVLAYDGESDRCLWTPLLDRRIYEEPQPLIELKSKSFRAVCTPEHTWAVRPQEKGGWRTQMRQTQHLKTCHRIVIAAPTESGDDPLTPREAAILGWLSGDGWISTTGGKGVDTYRAAIAQSKPDTLRILRDLLGSDASEQRSGETERTFPTGRTYKCRAQSKFELKAAFLRPFLEKIWGLPLPPSPWERLQPLVCHLSQPARAAMLEAMLLADGWKCKSKKPCWSFGQKAKPGVMDLFALLVTLEGRALGAPMIVKQSGLPVRRIRENRFAAAAYLAMEMLDPEPVWCPTTTYGTWIMRLDGYITITGNTRAAGRAIRFGCNIASALAEELGDDDGPASRNASPGASQPRQRAAYDPEDNEARKAAGEAAAGLCENCGNAVPGPVAVAARKQFGAVLCIPCGKARKQTANGTPAQLTGA